TMPDAVMARTVHGGVEKLFLAQFATETETIGCAQVDGGARIVGSVFESLRSYGRAAGAAVGFLQFRAVGAHAGFAPLPGSRMTQRVLLAIDQIGGDVVVARGQGITPAPFAALDRKTAVQGPSVA